MRDLLHIIVDSKCTTIKLNVIDNLSYMNNFAWIKKYLASAMDLIAKKSNQNSQQISDVSRDRGKFNRRGSYLRETLNEIESKEPGTAWKLQEQLLQ